MPNTRKFKLKRWLAVSAMVTLPYSAWVNAAGLGGMRVLSQMGQPFVAEIELINVSRDEFATLNARLAPPAAYEAANVRFDPALNTLRLSVERRPNGTPYIRAASARPVTEPYLNLLVDLTSQEGKFQRHYAALLEPPGLADPPAATTAPAAAAPQVETVPPAQKPVAVAPRAPRLAAPPAPTPSPAPAAAPKALSAPVAPVAPALPVTPPTASTAIAQAETKPVDAAKAEPAKPPVESVPAEAPKAEGPAEPPSSAPQPQAKPAPSAPLPPPAARGWMDSITGNLLPIAGGALALLTGLLGLWAWRRRKPAAELSSAAAAPMFKVEPRHTAAVAGAAAAGAAAVASATATAAPAEHTVATVTDMVDAIEEAQVYLDHGRDEQAEAILREALAKQPGREDVQLKLMEVLAARGDKQGFNKLATALHKQTGGHGERWQRATELGYMLDPTNPLYPATGNVVGLAVKPDAAANVDLDLGSPAAAPDAMSHTTDILLDPGAANTDMAKTMVLTRDSLKPTAPTAAEPVKPLDFDFELPGAPAAAAAKPAASGPAKNDHTIDFKVDLPDINLNLDDAPAASASTAAATPDTQWDEIQQKFDLAHAYQEMGDKEGMLETLQEIVREGNERQKASAQKMIDALK